MSDPNHVVEAASFGVGALPNCLFPLLNVRDSEVMRDNSAIRPGFDPGSGAFTVFHDRRGLARRTIAAGEEIFVDYGYEYFKGDRESKYGLMPFLNSYNAADQMLKKFRVVSQRLDKKLLSKNWDITGLLKPNNPKVSVLATELYSLLQAVIQIWPSRTQGALPSSADAIDYVLDVLGSTKNIYAKRSRKDLEWLKTYGTCSDHLVVGHSSIPHSGRGAFANKFLPKGITIAPVPLIHLPNRNVLNVYGGFLNPETKGYDRNATNIIHSQLMLNYCFGHRESTLLLCPYGIVTSLVNHGSSRNHQANAKIVWSSLLTSRPDWFNMSLEEWAFSYQTGLAFEFVAIRDIDEGEEVLIDYGDEWEAAWNAHLKSWTPKVFKSQILNEMEPEIEIPMQNEWRWPDVHLWCRGIYRVFQGVSKTDEGSRPCHVIAKNQDKLSGEVLYTVQLVWRFHGTKNEMNYEDYDHFSSERCTEETLGILFQLPRDALSFGGSFDFDEHNRYYSESWSFRHDLRIPEEIMPAQWKNMKVS